MQVTKGLLLTFTLFTTFVSDARGEVSGSFILATTNLARGVDSGKKTGMAASASFVGESHGAYVGAQVDSANDTRTTMFSLSAGYDGSIGDVSYGLSLWAPEYRSLVEDETKTALGDSVEAGTYVGYGPLKVTYYSYLSDFGDDWYVDLRASLGAIVIAYGQKENGFSHIDFTCSFNERVTITLSQVIDDVGSNGDDDINVAASYKYSF